MTILRSEAEGRVDVGTSLLIIRMKVSYLSKGSVSCVLFGDPNSMRAHTRKSTGCTAFVGVTAEGGAEVSPDLAARSSDQSSINGARYLPPSDTTIDR